MATKTAEKTASKQRGKPFLPGQSGNPAGKPPGTRHKVTQLMEKMLSGHAEKIMQTAIKQAEGGDLAAIRALLDRLYPPPKDRPVRFTLPDLSAPDGLLKAHERIMQAVADGILSPDEADRLVRILESRVKLFEAHQLKERVQALETALGGQRR